jgi:hypothetical protein
MSMIDMDAGSCRADARPRTVRCAWCRERFVSVPDLLDHVDEQHLALDAQHLPEADVA